MTRHEDRASDVGEPAGMPEWAWEIETAASDEERARDPATGAPRLPPGFDRESVA